MAAKSRFPAPGKGQQAQGGKAKAGAATSSYMLVLEYSSVHLAELEDGILLIASPCEPVKRLGWEPAGHSFHQAALRLLLVHSEGSGDEGKGEKGGEGGDGKSAADSSPQTGSIDPSAWESSRRNKKPGKGDDDEKIQQDHYALLGLAHLRYLATEDQIRKAYRDAALKFHPDKQAAMLLEETTEEGREAKKEEIETKFKAVQMAYEVLMDPTKRRVFDSTDEFDDDIPSDCAPDKFYSVYGPVFQRNAKWSLIQPEMGVPLLGDDSTSMGDVDKFYDFWWGFKSWREFPSEDEYDLEGAEGREHKRWMERQNMKMREKAKKEDYQRIRQLVENAWKRDPRVARRKEEEKREKQRRKEEKYRERNAKEEQEKKAAEEERRRKEEEDKRAAEEAAAKKKEKEKEKKLVRKERARLRTLAAPCTAAGAAAAAAVPFSGAPHGAPPAKAPITDDDVETLCTSLDLEKLKALCDRVEALSLGEAPRKAGVLRQFLRALEEDRWEGSLPGVPEETAPGGEDPAGAASAPPPAANGVSNGPASGAGPSAQEASGKQTPPAKAGGAPGGSPLGGSGSKSGKAGGAPAVEDRPWSKQELDILRRAMTKFPKGTKQRWEVIAGYLKTGRTADEVVRATKTVLLQKPDDSSAFESFLQKRKNPKDIASPLSTKDEVGLDTATAAAAAAATAPSDGSPAPAATAGAGAKAGEGGEGKGGAVAEATNGEAGKESGEAGAAGAVEVWSEVQEVALVKALKAFPKETDKRWERISAAVPGKTKAQCFKKFQDLRQNFRTKKAGAPGGAIE